MGFGGPAAFAACDHPIGLAVATTGLDDAMGANEIFAGAQFPRSSAALVSLRLPDVDLGNEPVAAFDAAIETLAFEHADLDLNHVEPAGVLRRVVELEPRMIHGALRPVGILRTERQRHGVERLSRMTRMRSASGKSTSTSSRMQRAKSSAVRRSVTLTLRQEQWASTKTKRLTAPLRRYS